MEQTVATGDLFVKLPGGRLTPRAGLIFDCCEKGHAGD